MKKVLSFFLSLIFVFCFSSCDSSKESIKRITIDEFEAKLKDHVEVFKVEESDSGFTISYSIRVLDAWEKKTISVQGKANKDRELESITMKLSVKNSKGDISEISSETIDYVKNIEKVAWSEDLMNNGSIRGYEASGYAFITHIVLLESVLFGTFAEDMLVADVIKSSESFFDHRNSPLTRNHWTCKIDFNDTPTFTATFKG